MSFDSFYIILGLLAVASSILALAVAQEKRHRPTKKDH